MSKTNINDFLVEGYRSAAPNGTVTSQERLVTTHNKGTPQ